MYKAERRYGFELRYKWIRVKQRWWKTRSRHETVVVRCREREEYRQRDEMLGGGGGDNFGKRTTKPSLHGWWFFYAKHKFFITSLCIFHMVGLAPHRYRHHQHDRHAIGSPCSHVVVNQPTSHLASQPTSQFFFSTIQKLATNFNVSGAPLYCSSPAPLVAAASPRSIVHLPPKWESVAK